MSIKNIPGARPHGFPTLPTLLALPVLAYAGLFLVQFAILLVAAERLRGAAIAAAEEAALPEATWQSTHAAALRRLEESSLARDVDPVLIEVNHRPAGARFPVRPGDTLAITLSVDAQAAMPAILERLALPLTHGKLSVRQERLVESR